MKIFTMNHSVHGFAAYIISFLKVGRKAAEKSLEDYKQEALIKQGRMQFEKLMQKGLSVPIALL